MLAAADIRFAYNGRAVLADVGIELQAGRILGILGVNGAGKSTLLKCLNRILTPQQ
ncbi:MAG: ABC transporter ATP-binding protein, partial [Desulfobacterales bacterium]